ncbi:WD40 repeat domain-containing serine/threonine protein kinase [Streptosporangium longisporum]|uniref:Protein kinase domain-containing protein n=1 Tax=Streptosporangium longisporum TaxID=46187 RepID=A0ABP6LC97_9ACTN
MANDTGRLISGRYRLMEVLGRGGMGTVWRARDESLHREVAIKELTLPDQLDLPEREMLHKRVQREARAAARLKHPSIITVHDHVVEADGSPWIVTEIIDGPSLDGVLRTRGRLPPSEVAEIGTRILSALEVAHAAGITHRDIKPANVLLEGERVVLTDFGIAAVEGDVALTGTGVTLGTPAFISPEQINGHRATAASDLWSLGATLYAAVEGRRPFTGTTAGSIYVAIVTRPPDPPVHAGPLAPLLEGLLRKDPARRLTGAQAAGMLAEITATPVSGVPFTGTSASGAPSGGGPSSVTPSSGSGDGRPSGGTPSGGTPSGGTPSGGTRPQGTTPADVRSGPGEPPPAPTAALPAVEHHRVPPPATVLPTVPSPGTPSSGIEPSRIEQAGIEPATAAGVSPTVVAPPGVSPTVAAPAGTASLGTAPATAPAALGDTQVAVPAPRRGRGSRTAIVVAVVLLAVAITGYLLRPMTDTAGDPMRVTAVARLGGHTETVNAVTFSPDGKTLASGGGDGSVILWNAETRKPIGKPLTGHTRAVESVAFSPDGKTLAAGGSNAQGTDSGDHTVVVWDAATREATGGPLTGHTDWVRSVAFSPDGKILASGSADSSVIMWDTATWEATGDPLTGHSDWVQSLAFDPDGKTLVTGSDDNTAIVWDVKTRQPIGDPLTGHTGLVRSVAFCSDEKIFATGGEDRKVIVWDAETRRPDGAPLTGHPGEIYALAFSPDGDTLAVATGSAVRLWDMRTRKTIGGPLTGHADSVWSLAFSPDGKTLATAGADRQVILWKVS